MSLEKKVESILEQQREYVIAMRREFHANPEMSWEEVRTSARIKEELDKADIPWIACAGTGIIASIEGKNPGKTVGLRADMDALSVLEQNEISYKSKTDGVMHACGHDGHAAMLLGAAKALNAVKDSLNGTVKLLFQPAEERVEGAKRMIEEGALEGIDAILGIHLWSGVETGQINIEAGPRMASGDYVIIDFIGKGGHGSMPDQTIDPIVVASEFIMNSQSVLSREKSPLESVVFTIGDFKSGTRFNVIPERAHLEGTLRCYGEAARTHFSEAIERYAIKVAEMHRAKADVAIIKGTPATINDPTVTEIAQRAGAAIVGNENMVPLGKTTGSEDMAYYLQKIPGVMAFVGAGFKDPSLNYPHHHPKFNMNEDSLKYGMALYFNFARTYLSE
ncbi:MAG: hypothetical protein PWQ12_509 [Clostridiales bacterium]|jgi:amidohydrolase|nr:hypothetical protein [Clostridiales bacterium]